MYFSIKSNDILTQTFCLMIVWSKQEWIASGPKGAFRGHPPTQRENAAF